MNELQCFSFGHHMIIWLDGYRNIRPSKKYHSPSHRPASEFDTNDAMWLFTYYGFFESTKYLLNFTCDKKIDFQISPFFNQIQLFINYYSSWVQDCMTITSILLHLECLP